MKRIPEALRCAQYLDLRTRKMRRIKPCHEGALGLQFLPNSTALLVHQYGDGKLTLVDLATGLQTTASSTAGTLDVSLSADSKWLVTARSDHRLVRRPLPSLQPAVVLARLRGKLRQVEITPDGQTVVSLTTVSGLRFHDATTGVERLRGHGHLGAVHEIVFAADGKTVLTASGSSPQSGDGTVRQWRVSDGKMLRVRRLGPGVMLSTSNDIARGRVLVARDNRIAILPGGRQGARPGSRLPIAMSAKDGVEAMALSADGRYGVLGTRRGELWILDGLSGRRLHRLTAHSSWLSRLALSGSGRRVVTHTSYSDRHLLLWDVPTGKLVARIPDFRGWSMPALSGRGDRLAAVRGSRIGTWRLMKGRFVAVGSGFEVKPYLTSLAFSPDGKTLATGHHGQIQLWSLGRDRPTARMDAHGCGVTAVAFSPDGSQLATGDGRGIVLLWKLQRRRIANWRDR